MNNMKIRFGGRLDLQIITEDALAVSASLILQDTDGMNYVFTEPYVDLVADFTENEDISVLPLGVYEYQINDNFADGLPEIYPDAENCGDNCSFPTITICESLEESES